MKIQFTISRQAVSGLALLLLTLAGCAGPESRRTGSGPAATTPVYDVIVVGAGLSGLTTAKELIRAKHSVLVLEATNRIGGRTITDRSFSVPIDFGAAWIHGTDKNPLTKIVDELNFRREKTKLDGRVFIGNHQLNDEEMKALEKDTEVAEDQMAQAAKAGRDQAVSDFVPSRSVYRALIASNIGPLESGAEADKTSSADSAAFHSEPDDFVAEGIGAFVARFGRDVPVQLNSPVTAIRYGGDAGNGVVVETRSGSGAAQTYRGRRVVVTVSTGILAARRIVFAPELPDSKWEAIRSLPMGLLNKVVFEFPKDVFANEVTSEWVLHQRPGQPAGRTPEVMAFVIKPLGADMAVGFYGADQARDFEKRGDQAAIDYAKAALTDMYGKEVVSRILDKKTKVTHWGQDPWTLGAYSAALPGKSAMHAELAKPVGDRVFFAGEACGPPEFNGSLAAAYVAGREASRLIVESLAREVRR